MDMNTHSKNREDDIRKQLKELEEICFGLYKSIFPAEVKSEEEICSYIKKLSDGITKESLDCDATARTIAFYSAYYQTVMFYLLSMCNGDDQIFFSLIKLAKTFSTEEQLPISKTILGILIGNIGHSEISSPNIFFAKKCIDCYKEFEAYYKTEMQPKNFFNSVDIGVRKYVDKQGYSCVHSEKKFLEVLRILRDASSETYFTLYQRWEA